MAVSKTNTIRFPKLGRKAIERYIQNTTFTLRLYKGSTSYNDGNNLWNYSQADYGGYSDVTISPSNWGSPTEDGFGNVYMELSSPVAFSHSGSGNVNDIGGWIMFESSTNDLLAVCDYASTKPMAASGDIIAISARVYLQEGTVPA